MNESPKPRLTHDWPQQPNGHYVEPAWASGWLFTKENFGGTIHDPCCGLGNIVQSARAQGLRATGADLIPRSPRERPVDFLKTTRVHKSIVFNPPYALKVNGERRIVIDRFVRHAWAHTTHKVAFFVEVQRVRAAHWLWDFIPIRRLWMVNPRPSCPPVEYILAGYEPRGGSKEYAWVVLEHGWKPRAGEAQLRRLDCYA
jgi:hypothetical protein